MRGRRRRVLLALLAALVAPSVADAQAGRPSSAVPDPASVARSGAASARSDAMSEAELLARWLREGRELDAARTEIGAARFDVVQASVLPNPHLGLGASFVLQGVPPDGMINFGPELSWELPIFGQVGARQEAANQELRYVEMQVAALIWERAADIRMAVIERAFADAEIDLLSTSHQEILEVRRILDTRAQLGVERRYDALRLEVQAEAIVASLGRARAALADAEGRLLALVAIPGLARASITRDGLFHPAVPDDPARATALALERRPDLKAFRRGTRARLAEAERYRVEAIPSPVLAVGGWFTVDEQSSNLGVGLSLPLPIFDRNEGHVGRAMARADGMRAAAEMLELQIRHEVESALERRRLASEALARFRAGPLATATELVERARAAYREGAFGVVELLDAHEAAWDARARALELEREVAEADAVLARVTAAGASR